MIVDGSAKKGTFGTDLSFTAFLLRTKAATGTFRAFRTNILRIQTGEAAMAITAFRKASARRQCYKTFFLFVTGSCAKQAKCLMLV
jgi:hypothetical protein